MILYGLRAYPEMRLPELFLARLERVPRATTAKARSHGH